MTRRGKYNSKPTELDGYRFDSKAEANRYAELKLAVNAGEIEELVVHPSIQLQPAFGKHRAITYEADFQYFDTRTGGVILEDVKGVETAVFKIKMKMLLYRYPGIDFRIVK